MYISKQWIEEYVDIPKKMSSEELADLLTTRVVEIEEVIDEAQFLDRIVVGAVTSVSKHPNADKLNVCMVDIGPSAGAQGKHIQVICGGSNVQEGMKVAMGMVGAKVRWHGEGDLIELIEATIRGEKSFGMICASDEIGLGEMFPKAEEKEILDLTSLDAKAGTPLAKALGLDDTVLDIDNKSMTHRPDLWGHYGVAREIAALLDTPLKEVAPPSIENAGKEKVAVKNKEKSLCPRYMAVMMEGITVGPSPDWLKKRLMSVGIGSINNVVDATNYVMLEFGQPMHAFDADRIASPHIIIRKAKDGEQFVALGGDEYELSSDDLVIADKKHPIALAGIKGSDDSGVVDETTRVILECANFEPVGVRKTSTRLGLRTDASARFEKALDPSQCATVLARCVALLQDMCPDARVVSEVADESKYSIDQGPLELDLTFLERKMGVSLSKEEVVRILSQLGFGVEGDGNILTVTIPTWRATKDISIPEDLVEEVARIYGYENIPTVMPKFTMRPAPKNPLRDLERRFKQLLAHEYHYTEVFNYSFVSPQLLEKIGDDPSKCIELHKPLAKDRPLIRRHIVPGLIENVETNLHRFDTVQIFETGRVFQADEDGVDGGPGVGMLPKEATQLGMAYVQKGNENPYVRVATDFAAAMARLGTTVTFKKAEAEHDLVHPGRYAHVMIGDTLVGHIAEMHPVVRERVGIEYRTALLQVTLDTIVPLLDNTSSYTPLPQYPAVERDIAMLVDATVEHDVVAAALIEANELTVDVELFDVYRGDPSAGAQDKIPEGKKSMAYRITYRSSEKTLETSEVDGVHAKVLEMLEREFAAEIR